MHETRLGADDFGQMSREGADVVLGLALDLVDAVDVEGDVARLGPDRLGGFPGNHAEFRLRVRRMRLDLEPEREAGLGLPDGGHFRAGIAGNHRKLRTSWAGREATPADLFFTPCFSRSGAGKPPVWARSGENCRAPGRRPKVLQAGQPALYRQADKLRVRSHAGL